MPLYDFECEECSYIEEILTSSAGNTEIVLTCPECEKETMKRKVGLSNFHLRGGGWYKDGYTKKEKLKTNKGLPEKDLPEGARDVAPEGAYWHKIPKRPKNNDKK